MTEQPNRVARIARIGGEALIVAALCAQSVVLVVVSTGLQEVSFRWMGLAGVATSVAAATAFGAALGALVVLWSHPRRTVALAAIGAAAIAWIVVGALAASTLRGMVAPESATSGQPFSVLSQNLWFENTSPSSTAAGVLARSADVVVLFEYTPEHREALRSEGAREQYRYRWELPAAEGAGFAVFSRIPFEEPELLSSDRGDVRLGARVTLELDSGPVELLAVHPVSPSDYWGLQRWMIGYRDLTVAVRDAGPDTVVAGDFNATAGHRRFRSVMAAGGLRDAADAAGAGFAATWPDRGIVPPVMRLDHVLVGPGVGVEGVEIVASGGSDHRGVEARLRFPRP